MSIEEDLKQVKSKSDFVEFIYQMLNELKHNPNEWENITLENFLDAIARYIEDTNDDSSAVGEDSEQLWATIAFLNYVGSRYE
ncbi:DUF7660 family protein [Paenibacillus elgii]|uniref:DUF7660 family protein n=1 Tax=Paenibacillus elgii TaxID=189691 RepID=UPI000FD6EF2E|nr:hypothetical protein [Paenibacillus elgii]NEN82595.1 hypothetical protein [Paenibacillus elgii]